MSNYPYCIHGVYVGGCGIDYMCGQCEMGDEAPTINELRPEITRIEGEIQRVYAAIGKAAVETPGVDWSGTWKILGVPLERKLGELENQISEIFTYTQDCDSREWIYDRHRAHIAEWEKDEEF